MNNLVLQQLKQSAGHRLVKMLLRLLHRQKYYHLKLIHEHPKGIQNRYRDTGDKWVEAFRHPHVKTYVDHQYNCQTHEHSIDFKYTEQQETYVQKIQHSYKPGVAALTENQKFIKPVRPDDYDMQRDISQMTIKKFIQEGRQNFTRVHEFVVYSISFLLLHIALYMIFLYNKQLPKSERVRVLNAEILESYHFDSEQSDIKRIIERIQIVNGEYQKRLAESKNQ